jgi:hypothetical protein
MDSPHRHKGLLIIKPVCLGRMSVTESENANVLFLFDFMITSHFSDGFL